MKTHTSTPFGLSCRRLTVLLLFAFTAAVLQFCSPSWADPRPEMPTRFDRETVQRLINEVDKQHNATILKVGYFARRGKVELPQSEGMTLLKKAIEGETTGSERWFILQAMYGFAALRVPGASPQEGLSAYAAVFDRAGDAQKVGASYQLSSAVNEFVFSVTGRLGTLGLRSNAETQEVLLKAWTAYVVHLGQVKPGQAAGSEPLWAEAIAKTHTQKQFLPHIEKVLSDDAVPKTYGLLKTAAGVFETEKPERAIELWQQAKLLLPRDDINEVADYYKSLVNLLVQEEQLSEAIKAQQEYFKQTGHGQAQLVMLHLQNKDEAATDAAIKALGALDANEREVNALAEALQKSSQDSQHPDAAAGERAVKLLQEYLAAPRQRDVEQELRARKTLGLLLLNQKKYQEALAALNADHLRPPFSTPRARSYAGDVERLRATAASSAEK